jgi:hypothetical protein
MEATIKAYYKAVTTKKRFIVQEDISTNYFCMRYTATNNVSNFEDYSSDTLILSTEYYYENLDVLAYLFKELSIAYTRYCYELTFEEFLNRYELSINQYNKIKRLIK